MSVLGQQHITSVDALSPGCLTMHHLNPQFGNRTTVTTTEYISTGEFSVSTGEFQSVRQHSVDCLSTAGILIESPRAYQSVGSHVGNSRFSVDSVLDSRGRVEPHHSAGHGVFVTSQQSVDSLLSGGAVVPRRHTCQVVDVDHDVFCESAPSQLSQTADVVQPPPLPPKTSFVSHNVFVPCGPWELMNRPDPDGVKGP